MRHQAVHMAHHRQQLEAVQGMYIRILPLVDKLMPHRQAGHFHHSPSQCPRRVQLCRTDRERTKLYRRPKCLTDLVKHQHSLQTGELCPCRTVRMRHLLSAQPEQRPLQAWTAGDLWPAIGAAATTLALTNNTIQAPQSPLLTPGASGRRPRPPPAPTV